MEIFLPGFSMGVAKPICNEAFCFVCRQDGLHLGEEEECCVGIFSMPVALVKKKGLSCTDSGDVFHPLP